MKNSHIAADASTSRVGGAAPSRPGSPPGHAWPLPRTLWYTTGAPLEHCRHSIRLAALTYASTCVVCHRISGEGGKVGPDLTSVGERRDAAGNRAVIEYAKAALGASSMPTFRDKLTPAQIDALVSYLASR